MGVSRVREVERESEREVRGRYLSFELSAQATLFYIFIMYFFSSKATLNYGTVASSAYQSLHQMCESIPIVGAKKRHSGTHKNKVRKI